MKKLALYAVTTMAALSLAGQALAHGGSMGGGGGGAGMTSQLGTAQPVAGGADMQQGCMQQGGMQQGGMQQGGMTAAQGQMQSGIDNEGMRHSGMPATTEQPVENQ